MIFSGFMMMLIAIKAEVYASQGPPPLQMQNVLRFGYGTNFKYTGKLHHNLDRSWVVTRIKLPKWRELKINPLGYDCTSMVDQLIPDLSKVSPDKMMPHLLNGKERESYIHVIRLMCNSAKPLLQHMEKKENFSIGALRTLMTDDLYAVLPGLDPDHRHPRSLALFFKAVPGLITLAKEAVSAIINWKRNKAMAKAVKDMRKSEANSMKMVKELGQDFLMYGDYTMESLDSIADVVNKLHNRQTILEQFVKGEFQDRQRGLLVSAGRSALFGFQLQLYLQIAQEEHDKVYGTFIQEWQKLMVAIGKLSQGYLPPELFPPHKLRKITQMVERKVNEHYPDYGLALKHVTQYYDMKLVTFSIDQISHSLIVAFPVLIKNDRLTEMQLYEIEVVPVPVLDANTEADSYTQAMYNKPYIATNGEHYIQLRVPELRMCKSIKFDYYCEEMFLVKHKSKHSCESAIFFDLEPAIIDSNCQFSFHYNVSVPPSVLDGGQQVVLANMKKTKKLICTDHHNMATPIPDYTYVMVNRNMFCMCELDAGFAYVLRQIGSCNHSHDSPIMYHTINLAFFNQFQQTNPELAIKFDTNLTQYEQPLDIFLEDFNHTWQWKGIPTIKEYFKTRNRKYNGSALMTMDQHSTERDPFAGLDTWPFHIFYFLGGVLTVLSTMFTVCMTRKYLRTKAVVSALALRQLPSAQALPTPPTTTRVICQEPWITFVITAFTIIGVLVYVWKNLHKMQWLKGFMKTRQCMLYMFVCNNTHYIPLQVTQLTGQIHQYNTNEVMTPDQITLTPHCTWDTITIDWKNVRLSQVNKHVALVTTIVIPIWDKIRIRRMLKEEYNLHLMLKQGTNWYSLYPKTTVART